MTAYWAKDRYSTSTSRPLFSSLRNSLTHLWRTKHLITFSQLNTSKAWNKLNSLDSPNVIGPKRYLQLSEHLSWLLNSPPKFLWRNRKRCPFLSKYVLNLGGQLQKPVSVWKVLMHHPLPWGKPFPKIGRYIFSCVRLICNVKKSKIYLIVCEKKE